MPQMRYRPYRKYRDDHDRRMRQGNYLRGRTQAFMLYKQIGYAHLCLVTHWLLAIHPGSFRLPYDYQYGWQTAIATLARAHASTEKASALKQVDDLNTKEWLAFL